MVGSRMLGTGQYSNLCGHGRFRVLSTTQTSGLHHEPRGGPLVTSNGESTSLELVAGATGNNTKRRYKPDCRAPKA